MVDVVKTFREVDKAEKSEFLAVGGGDDKVTYGGKHSFGGQFGAETVL